EQAALVQADAGAARTAALHGVTETLVHVSLPRTRGVVQRDQKAAGMRRVVAVVAAGPGVDVDGSVRSDSQMACMTDTVGKNGRAKAGRQRKAAVILRTCRFGLCRGVALRVRPGAACAAGAEHRDCKPEISVTSGKDHG